MFAEIGALWVDHVAVTTDRFEDTSRHYLAMPNARVLRGPGWNAAQKVHFLFVGFGGDLCIEILGLPEDGDSPIAAHAASGGGAYHLCHAVADLDAALAIAGRSGCRVVAAAKHDDAYDGRRVAFLMHPAHGLFELVEAYGSLWPQSQIAPAPAPAAASSDTDMARTLQEAFASIFPGALPNDPAQWRATEMKHWDSLQHMRLIMEIERRFDVTLPSQMLGELKSYDAFLSALGGLPDG
ncbi:VOC family protein [Roseovarius sp. EGI FJ00037]|uniref:VOC family protein n=1 Tax=Roseovarius TaxID=74030 RepID=UPI0022A7AE0A|nr:VOC family protein [Roseovarius sp. EGI FJ00037]MCZ0811374.1 VOC family protein [Roseovarius sp. EGI FJ00037]